MLFSQVMDAEKTNQAWQIFINFGVVGVIAFVTLSFVALVIWTMFVIAKRICLKYFPEIFDETVKTIKSVRESQEGIAANQRLVAENAAKQAENMAKLIDLGMSSQQRDADLATVIKAKMDPNGDGYKNHVFSSVRVEEFLGLGLDILEEWLDKDTNLAIKLDWKRHIEAMRNSLQRQGSRA